MRLFIPKESRPAETRVAAVPETVRKLVQAGWSVAVEPGAGLHSHHGDASYEHAGARLCADWSADAVLKVAPPLPGEVERLRPGALLVSLAAPHRNLDQVSGLAQRGVDWFAMDLVPRIARAQAMDALSSQANIAGYKAVLLAASRLGKYVPLLMTAAGTLQPARVLVLGAGVAGLQAIATARRLGAVVEASDVRAAAREQVESLGAKFIQSAQSGDASGSGGYAREQDAAALEAQRRLLEERIAQADVVVCTALVPGRPAPRLIRAAAVAAMRPGSVIVDLAVSEGGNCELCAPGERQHESGVWLLGFEELAASLPVHASLAYARNTAAALGYLARGGALELDLGDELVRGALLVHGGQVLHEATLAQLGAAASAA